MFNLCSNYVNCSYYVHTMFQLCSNYVQTIFKLCSNYFQTMFKLCSYYVHQDEHHETKVVLNSNLMIPDFPHNVRIRLAQLKKKLLHPDVAKSLSCWLSQFSFSKLRQPTGQRLSNVWMQQTKISIGPILFLYYEESLI